MNLVVIIAIAFVLLIPISALGQEFEYEAVKEQFEQEYGTFEELQQEGKDIIKNIPVEKIEKEGEGIIKSIPSGGGCLIATATYGSELSPQIQQLRELRDNQLLNTEAGSSFINSFNDFYYSFSPYIADLERENPIFKEMVKIAITPMITSLSILNYVDMDSETEVLGYGISLIILNVGMYVGIPVIVIMRIRK
ncbi:MAG: CFI-box-CTERM domain-containing protein [Nitrosopumilus sp.]